MKITIIYDNEAFRKDLRADWGFSCLVDVYEKKILFDTGTKGSILLENMKILDIDPSVIEEVFISHSHGDHTGGLSDFLKVNPVPVYVPASYGKSFPQAVAVREPIQIHENIFSTGELNNTEQSLIVKTERGVVVIAGCSHPGVKPILEAAAQFGNVTALIGGLHGFTDFDLLKGLELVCATHCTRYKSEIQSLYPDIFVEGGAGRILEL